MARGGRRKGAGRPKGTGKFGEPTKAVRLPISMIDRIMNFIERKGLAYPLYSGSGRNGATKVLESAPTDNFDLVDHLIPNPPSTFFMRVLGDSMNGAGIFEGDLLIVDRNREPENGDVVVAVVNHECLIRRYLVKGKKIELKPESSKFSTVRISDPSECAVCGVVQNMIRSF